MRFGSLLQRGGLGLCLVVVMISLLASTGCFGSRGFPGTGQLRVRMINEGTDPVTDITVIHGEGFITNSQLSPGSRTTSSMRIQQDEDVVISYFHPRIGSARETFDLRAREKDRGYLEIRFDRLGYLDVRTRYELKEER